MKTRTFSTRSGKRVKDKIPEQAKPAEKVARSKTPVREGSKDLRKRRGVAICPAKKCKLPPGHNDGIHNRERMVPARLRRWARGPVATRYTWTTKKGDRKPARRSGVALASPTSRRGEAQRAEGR